MTRSQKLFQESQDKEEDFSVNDIIEFQLKDKDEKRYLAKDSLGSSSSQDGRDTHESSNGTPASSGTSENSNEANLSSTDSFDNEARPIECKRKNNRAAQRVKRSAHLARRTSDFYLYSKESAL